MPEYIVNIDFNESSIAWMRNKKKWGQSYRYVCGSQTKKGTPCQKHVKKPNTKCPIHNNSFSCKYVNAFDK